MISHFWGQGSRTDRYDVDMPPVQWEPEISQLPHDRLSDEDLAQAVHRAGVLALLGLCEREQKLLLKKVLEDGDDVAAAVELLRRRGTSLARW